MDSQPTRSRHETDPPAPTPWPARAVRAWRERGSRYAWHKALRRVPGRWIGLKRRLIYADPRDYWTLRGGHDYFREQEAQPARDARARWMAGRIAAYRPRSVLEVGCGYGKQLRAIHEEFSGDVLLVGIDFSPSQLRCARDYLAGLDGIGLVLGSGAELPFPDGAFDLVLTSAVILHNRPSIAERMRREVARVARRWAVHNEDTDVSYNRFGYDTAAWYNRAGVRLAEWGPFPEEAGAGASQFCVADLLGTA